ncbi:disease resistance protein (TIR-NBS-LRR class), putative [Medicago truncatula]|uniref:Disease resistance protein (TIR-NBS-LRR class), putative n=2 Tax=Medicago truncatula TaxID=3880 RepID=G7K8G3_MEDTR|nr:disease resistance protein (TIR-NBS-LRR class), putative [Medicago truncatula]
MLNKLKALNIKCEFEPFFNPIPSLEHFSSGNFVCFEPIKETSDRLLEALENRKFYKIGLYGKRGSGKTKLVKAVAEKARYLRVFAAVLFITVSQNPNVKQIQDEIADFLDLKFDKNTEVGRARELYLTLESTDRPILVILDDVWENLDLEELGIPCNSNRCKVLLTTHCKQEFALMNCQEEIPLCPLSIEEAWTLFKKHSGIDDESSTDLLNVAYEVAIECQGLPGTIKDVGSSLRSKPIEEWKTSLDGLRHSMSQYDIFISFRGKDTRDSFTGFLYDALCREGFKTFMDDEGLKGGDEISSSLIKAIEASRISVIVFSKKIAHSSWCLDELVTILKCKKMKNQQILPIFYKIEPSDVRHQKNSYERGMAKQVKRFGNDFEKLQIWRSALLEVASLSGITYKTGYEYKLVQTIVERVKSQI